MEFLNSVFFDNVSRKVIRPGRQQLWHDSMVNRGCNRDLASYCSIVVILVPRHASTCENLIMDIASQDQT